MEALPFGWSTIHDVRWPGRRLANVDHVVVGPGGVFVVDSKNWSGRITVTGGHLRQNGRSREKAVAGAADAALAVAEIAGPHASSVLPVMCFVGPDHRDLSGWCREVAICTPGNLVRMLTTRKHVLSPQQVNDAWLRLDGQLRGAADSSASTGAQTLRARRSSTSDSGSRPRGQRGNARGRRRGRRGASLPRAFAGLMLAFGLVMYGPQIASVLGGLIARQVATELRPATCPSVGAVGTTADSGRTLSACPETVGARR